MVRKNTKHPLKFQINLLNTSQVILLIEYDNLILLILFYLFFWKSWMDNLLITPEEVKHQKHPKYKEFHESVLKCLNDFQSAKEWKDLVQRLGKLQAVCVFYLQITV